MSQSEILAALASGKLTADKAGPMLDALHAKAVGDEFRTPKLTEGGAVNLGKIPGANAQFGCVMYAATVEYIIKHQKAISEYLVANESGLSRKGDDEVTVARKAKHPERIAAAAKAKARKAAA
jgi:hypothetical protein